MKRLFLIVALVLLATAAFAEAVNRDVLITSDGTVYSIASEPSEDGLSAKLALTIQSAGKITLSLLPDTIDNGVNSRPALAYDAESKTLFVLWQRVLSATSSELLVVPYQNDKWQPAVSIDDRRALRYNLSVGITHHVRQRQRDESFADAPALVLHAVWWEQAGGSEGARYAVMSLGGGTISEPDVHDMTDFISASDAPAIVDDKFNRDFLRHVTILDGPTPDAIDVLFADSKTKNFYRTTLRPIADGRLHIPVGARPGAPHIGAPKALSADWSGRTSTVTSRDGKTIIFCNLSENKLTYVKVSDGKWSAVQEVALSAKVTAEAAMAALTRMVAATE